MVKVFFALILIISLSGCATAPTPIYIYIPKDAEDIKLDEITVERNAIFKIYDKDNSNIVILAFEKVYQNTFDIAKNYLQYSKEDKKPTYDSFWIWLVKNLWYKDMFEKGDKFGLGKKIIDNRFNDKEYIEIKKGYELFERMNK